MWKYEKTGNVIRNQKAKIWKGRKYDEKTNL